MQIRYERDLSHNYVIVEIEGGDNNDFRYKMLEAQKTDGLLPCTIRRINGRRFLYYEIDGMKNMATRYSTGRISGSQLSRLFSDLRNTCSQMGEYLLDDDSIVLSKETVFVDLATGAFRFLCCPGDNADDLQEFALALTDLVDSRDEEAVNAAYSFCEKVQEEGYSLEALCQVMTSEIGASQKEQIQTEVPRTEIHYNVDYDMDRGAVDYAAPRPEVSMAGFYEDDEDIDDEELRASIKLSSQTCYIYGVCALIICLASYYIRTNYRLSPRENIISLSVMTVTVIIAAASIITGLYKKKKNEMNEIDKNIKNEISVVKKRKAAEKNDRKAKARNQVSDKRNRKTIYDRDEDFMDDELFKVSDRKAFGQSAAVLQPDLQMFARRNDYAGVNQVNMKGSSAESAHTTVLQVSSASRARRLYSRGEDSCIQIGLDRLPLTIGKMAGCVDFTLPGKTISRIHARLFKEGDGVYLEDLDSTNGTFRNGQQLRPQQPVRLIPGDEVQFADIVFDYR